MSGIAGFYNLDGAPADPLLLRRMTDAVAHRGPDDAGHWVDGPVALGHRMLHTTPESLLEQQPLSDETGSICLTLDGRVDNRDELRSALLAKGARLRSDTDAELVLQAYQVWGEESPVKILGDFAFAIWDGTKQRLFCARDILGIKPLYYYSEKGKFLFGSELRALFADESVRRQPNEGMVAEYLANAITSKSETLYSDILRLPPAHFMIVRPGNIRISKYWEPDPKREIRYRSDDEYADHFRELFRSAVSCRLRSHRPVGCYLSGGLDSSSIVAMAQLIYQEGTLADSGFETFSLLYPGMSCDESEYIREILATGDLKSNFRNQENLDPSFYAESARQSYDFPEYPNGTTLHPLRALAQQKGMRVLLSGSGGDEWLSGSLFHYADFLNHARIPSLIRQLQADRRESPYIFSPKHVLLYFGLRPLLPDRPIQAAKRMMGRNAVPHWIERGFSEKIGLSERMLRQDPEPSFRTFAQRGVYRMGTSSRQVESCEMIDRVAALFQVEQRMPFNDRRIIEFALALPEEQRWRDGRIKFVLRQAMRGHLPEAVRQRVKKAEFSQVFEQTLGPAGQGVFNALAVARMGWVDGERIAAMWRERQRLYQQGNMKYALLTVPLWMIFGTEIWFRTMFSESARTESHESVNMHKQKVPLALQTAIR